MNQDVKQLWLTALRSGKYEQTRDRLKDQDGYCCLGVLTDVFCATRGVTWDEALTYEEEDYSGEMTTVKHEDEDLPPAVEKWAELNSSNPIIDGAMISTYNDGTDTDALNFIEIANLIEANL